MATGLLTVLVGRAVKASEYDTEHGKTYEAGLTLGITTDTEDVTGQILTQCDSLPTAEEVKIAAEAFVGDIFQVPPMYSALKREGQKLCDLARRGIEVEREARPVTVHSLTVNAVRETEGKYRLTVSCSKGTYIRTLCADLGAALGCGGAMSSLRRTETGGLTLENAVTLEALEAMSSEEREALLLPTESLFVSCPILTLPPFFARLAQAGNEIYLKKVGVSYPVGQRLRLYDDSFFSLGEVREYDDGLAVKPIKKFRLP
jgi:tRNA pseudouridine55 synthase